jgi:uncharacterized protein YbjQ (UPF0145 family)
MIKLPTLILTLLFCQSILASENSNFWGVYTTETVLTSNCVVTSSQPTTFIGHYSGMTSSNSSQYIIDLNNKMIQEAKSEGFNAIVGYREELATGGGISGNTLYLAGVVRLLGVKVKLKCN